MPAHVLIRLADDNRGAGEAVIIEKSLIRAQEAALLVLPENGWTDGIQNAEDLRIQACRILLPVHFLLFFARIGKRQVEQLPAPSIRNHGSRNMHPGIHRFIPNLRQKNPAEKGLPLTRMRSGIGNRPCRPKAIVGMNQLADGLRPKRHYGLPLHIKLCAESCRNLQYLQPLVPQARAKHRQRHLFPCDLIRLFLHPHASRPVKIYELCLFRAANPPGRRRYHRLHQRQRVPSTHDVPQRPPGSSSRCISRCARRPRRHPSYHRWLAGSPA